MMFFFDKKLRCLMSEKFFVLDDKTIYRCIHDQFPNKASVQGLMEV